MPVLEHDTSTIPGMGWKDIVAVAYTNHRQVIRSWLVDSFNSALDELACFCVDCTSIHGIFDINHKQPARRLIMPTELDSSIHILCLSNLDIIRPNHLRT